MHAKAMNKWMINFCTFGVYIKVSVTNISIFCARVLISSVVFAVMSILMYNFEGS
ncbi:hypothetical protein HMPREF9446_01307 [Bacteroides fluxus YIT 12057]|uniref:Uncharacterized protein n=1 Tax=Bacteroides fluxus YIT 12057 TaxID=763034 RepID=F3PRF6_9BACE|nr:hypothetical protein HMPREF9446_01307 [Bacteroides fluxus YIT 12057]